MHALNTTPKIYRIWFSAVCFLLFQFFLQLSSGVIISSLKDELQLSSLAIGILASSFYYVYTAMQIPVGILFDRYNTRFLLTITAFFCAFGCIIFSISHSFFNLFLGRFLMGAGASFAFIGVSHLLRIYFPLHKFSFMMGLSETLGFTITVLAMIGMSNVVNYWGWRGFIQIAGFIGLIISMLCWQFIPSEPNKPIIKSNIKSQLMTIITNKFAWINGLFVGLVFTVVTVFGALWAVPFVQLKIACSLNQATIISTMLLLGAGLSCPLFGKLTINLRYRKQLMHASCLSTAILLLIIIFKPISSTYVLGFLMFSAGLCCGSYLLSYTIANEITAPEARSTATGFTNTLAMITAPLFQPLIGYFLDLNNSTGTLTLWDYQLALLIIPAAVLVGNILIFFLPNTLKETDNNLEVIFD